MSRFRIGPGLDFGFSYVSLVIGTWCSHCEWKVIVFDILCFFSEECLPISENRTICEQFRHLNCCDFQQPNSKFWVRNSCCSVLASIACRIFSKGEISFSTTSSVTESDVFCPSLEVSKVTSFSVSESDGSLELSKITSFSGTRNSRRSGGLFLSGNPGTSESLAEIVPPSATFPDLRSSLIFFFRGVWFRRRFFGYYNKTLKQNWEMKQNWVKQNWVGDIIGY